MLKSLKREDRAFTIIEVLIVLTIVGLIMLIVFLAVPALQRNSRNTQRKHDVASLLAAVSEYTGNHDGNLPASGIFGNVFSETSPKLGYYDPASNVSWYLNSSPVLSGTPSDADTVYVANYSKCDPSGNGIATATGATKRSIVATYRIETADGTLSPQCKES